MSNLQPSINIYRSMDGISQDHLEAVCDWALTDGGLIKSDLRGFLRPILQPQARLIDSDELRHFDAHPDLDIKIDSNVLNYLQGHIEASLPLTAKDDITTELVPASIHEYKSRKADDDKREVLKVATSEVVMIERLVAKLAVCDFFGLDPDAVPEGIWLPDENIVGVHFAKADSLRQKEALHHLARDLSSGRGSLSKLPKRVTLQKVRSGPSRY